MKIVIWIAQILLAVLFLLPGFMKLITPLDELVQGMPWVEDFSEIQIRVIAILEVLAVIGLILPMVLNKYKFLVPLSALGLSLTMIGAMVTHLLRGESIIINIVLFALCLLVFYLRRGFLRNKQT